MLNINANRKGRLRAGRKCWLAYSFSSGINKFRTFLDIGRIEYNAVFVLSFYHN